VPRAPGARPASPCGDKRSLAPPGIHLSLLLRWPRHRRCLSKCRVRCCAEQAPIVLSIPLECPVHPLAPNSPWGCGQVQLLHGESSELRDGLAGLREELPALREGLSAVQGRAELIPDLRAQATELQDRVHALSGQVRAGLSVLLSAN
jgi:hypothetical protein